MLLPWNMQIQLYPAAELSRVRSTWSEVLQGFSWELDPELAGAMYTAVPVARRLCFLTEEPLRGGSIVLGPSEARPDPRLLCDELDTRSVTVFPANFSWAVRGADPDEALRFGFPRVSPA